MNKKSSIESVRINMNLPVVLVNKVKEYANNLGINYTSTYIILINKGLKESEVK